MATINDLENPPVDISDSGVSKPRSSGSVTRQTGTTTYQSTVPKDVPYDVSPSMNILGENRKYLSNELLSQIDSFLQNSQIPQARKDAFLSAYSGLSSSLPTESWLDKLSSSIIGTSNYQKAMNKYGTDVGALLAQYNITDYQEKYNSAEQQASRMLQAGVNPDLQGTSVDAGSSADFDDQATGATSPSSVYPSYDGTSAISTIMQVVSGAFSWASSIQGLVRNGIDMSAAQTAEESADLDYIQKLVHNSQFSPDTSVTFPDLVHSDVFNEDVSLFDKDGNLLPYSKLNDKQKDAVRSYMQEHNERQLSGIWENYFFVNSSFSENKKRRLKQRMSDYISSEQFRRKWYEDHRNLIASRLSSAKESSDPMFNAVDVLLESCQKALLSSDYIAKTDENIYHSEVYKKLVENGVPKEEAEQRARIILRDKADNQVLDDFRDNLLNILNPQSEAGRKADKWEKLSARVSLLLLYYIRRSISHPIE